ncbi:hypothetical protein Agabi119p4_10596 [Agaricus bisporus var. burnettii]|uniref:Uncharacterized protein n=1 Tax=Agaricus bisporus var. burnettii TaxID=192524 RepID=A0A8H7EWR6_AGABI|nr:hypothetical protein Agabi119p4_10596 [Agaricus bisporus var. burnettii]
MRRAVRKMRKMTVKEKNEEDSEIEEEEIWNAMKTIPEAGEHEDLVSDAYNNVNEDGDAPSGLSATMANDEDDNLVNDDR